MKKTLTAAIVFAAMSASLSAYNTEAVDKGILVFLKDVFEYGQNGPRPEDSVKLWKSTVSMIPALNQPDDAIVVRAMQTVAQRMQKFSNLLKKNPSLTKKIIEKTINSAFSRAIENNHELTKKETSDLENIENQTSTKSFSKTAPASAPFSKETNVSKETTVSVDTNTIEKYFRGQFPYTYGFLDQLVAKYTNDNSKTTTNKSPFNGKTNTSKRATPFKKGCYHCKK